MCQYTLRYASEILHAFKDENCFLSTFESINMMSIGCGGCPDLMAMEMLLYDSGLQFQYPIKAMTLIRYGCQYITGYDVIAMTMILIANSCVRMPSIISQNIIQKTQMS